MNLFQSSVSDFSFADLRQIPPSKHALNIVVGFDGVLKQVKIMRMFGLNFNKSTVDTFAYTKHFLSEEFLTEFKDIFAQYISTLPTSNSLAVYVVLPDNAVAMDNVALPLMSNNKIKTALTTELQKLYKSYKELQFNSFIAGSNKQYVVFYLTVLRKNYLTNLYRNLSVNKFYPKTTSFSANCTLNTVLQFKPALRKKTFILLDVKSDYTKAVFCLKGKTAGFADFKLGTVHLADDKVLQENMQYDHDVADLAIINAKERARMKALTVDADDLEEIAANVADQLSTGDNLNAQQEALTADGAVSQVLADSRTEDVNALQSAVDEIVQSSDDGIDETDAEQEEAERREKLAQQMAESRKKKIFARKMPKRLPKFMQRPVPETAEGIVYENFRMIMKWALLYKYQLAREEYLPRVDSVVVNIDPRFNFVFDMANSEEEGNDVRFEPLGNLPSSVINANLDLVGALYTGMYNKRQNF